MDTALASLHNQSIWHFFEEICQIPRPSKKEEKIITFLIAFAQKRNLSYRTDKAGNLLINKPASDACKNKPIVVLQSHVDMVCEKNASTQHDFDTDPIQPYIDGGWVRARGTTLGADDGIGMAAQLALLDSNSIEHGPLECLFTIDEETGLTGAFGLGSDFFRGKILLNLDSEDEGILFIGCAGGMDTTAILNIETEQIISGNQVFKIEISGLKGGHSGDDINKELGNAVKIVARIISSIDKKLNLQLIDISGGNLRNAIAREASAIIAISGNSVDESVSLFNKLQHEIKNELQQTEPNLTITIVPTTNYYEAISKQFKFQIINVLNALPHGVISMSKAIPGLVETSTNLASIKRIDAKTFEIGTSQRSDVDSLKKDIGNQVKAVFNLAGIDAKQSTGYPGWKPKTHSPILQLARESYVSLFGNEPLVTAIHAGLECGLFLDKYPNLDMISFGPTIKGAHSPDERLEIASVDKFWLHLVDVLAKIQ